jgi:hypothetical protein
VSSLLTYRPVLTRSCGILLAGRNLLVFIMADRWKHGCLETWKKLKSTLCMFIITCLLRQPITVAWTAGCSYWITTCGVSSTTNRFRAYFPMPRNLSMDADVRKDSIKKHNRSLEHGVESKLSRLAFYYGFVSYYMHQVWHTAVEI